MTAASADAPNILEISGLQAGYWDLAILSDVEISVRQGSMVTIIGPNGSGKSTLLKSIYGLAKVRSGSIKFKLDGHEHELRGLQPHQITVKGINYLPQLEGVFAALTVRENLEIGAISHRRLFNTNFERVLEIFPVLRNRLKARGGALSGGQQKMLGLARALMTDPKLLLLDEPSAGLAPALVDEMFQKISDIKAMGVAILIVEQNARRSLSFSDYGYAMELGRKRFEGPAQDLLQDPKVVELYLGNLDRYRDLRKSSSS